MAFFDDKQEILKVELTTYGRFLISRGKFRPAYYAFFDDDVLYDSLYADITESQNSTQTRILEETPSLKPPFSLLAGEFTVTGGEGEDRCMVSRIPSTGGEPQRRSCSLAIADILRTMASLGAGYPEALELIQQADNCKSVSCRFDSCHALQLFLYNTGCQSGQFVYNSSFVLKKFKVVCCSVRLSV